VQPATTRIEPHTPTSKQQRDVALKLHVVSVYSKCFKCFRCMLQVFYIDVAKVDRDVAHIAMVFSSVYTKCFICFRHMLQLFYLDILKVDLDVAYTCMLQVYVSSISYACCKYLSGCCICFGYKRVFLVFQTYIKCYNCFGRMFVSSRCCKSRS
jgi:hypothetical protein